MNTMDSEIYSRRRSRDVLVWTFVNLTIGLKRYGSLKLPVHDHYTLLKSSRKQNKNQSNLILKTHCRLYSTVPVYNSHRSILKFTNLLVESVRLRSFKMSLP